MTMLICECYIHLIRAEILMRFRGLDALNAWVRGCVGRSIHLRKAASEDDLNFAMQVACVFYVKKVACLQGSSALTVLMRRHGYAAQMIIGAQILPAHFHAWVECASRVVNDKPYMPEIYQVLERC